MAGRIEAGHKVGTRSSPTSGDTVINWANFAYRNASTGAVLGALLALISSGLTIIYGTLGVLNLAHGAMFMLGGYAGWVAYSYSGSFIVAVIAGSLFVMLVGVVMERLVIRSFYGRPHEDQLLLTFGLSIVFVEAARFCFGSLSKIVPAPAGLVGITPLGFMMYPAYRLALLGIVTVALLLLYIVLYRTRVGMIVRAGIEDSVMVRYARHRCLQGVHAGVRDWRHGGGFRRHRQRTCGVGLAGRRRGNPRANLRRRRYRRRRFVPRRRFRGGLIAGEIISIPSMFNPGYAYVMLFAAMTLVLVIRPYGLLGTAGRE